MTHAKPADGCHARRFCQSGDMRTLRILAALLLSFAPAIPTCAAGVPGASLPEKNRLVVLTDVGADPDDTMSLVRLMLYSNEIDIEGIVATTSVWKRTSVSPELVERVLGAYEKVRPNLLLHEPGYPEASALRALVKTGLPKYGMEGVGENCDSEGSAWIVRTLEKEDPRPLWVAVWGGANTLAQALYRIEKTHTPEETARLVGKLRVYTISDQDDSGPWMRRTFPALFIIASPGDDYGSSTWIAINSEIEGIDNRTVSNAWLREHIQQGHGALGAAYPDVAYGMEGDTPSFLALIPNGLNVPEHPDWGGWGGRYVLRQPSAEEAHKGVSGLAVVPETRPLWTDASDTFTPHLPGAYGRAVQASAKSFTGNKVTLWRWRDDFQNDFAARMEWCVKPFAGANHPPVALLAGAEEVTVHSGQGFGLDASPSTDPDGDSLSFLWFVYPEAGSRPDLLRLDSAENLSGVWLVAAKVDKEERAQVIVAVTDKGAPPLTRYRRIFVRILP